MAIDKIDDATKLALEDAVRATRDKNKQRVDDAMKMASEDEFWAIRGKAIQAYASLEQALARLFAVLAGTDEPTASIIFFKIHSADARNKIMEKLLQKKLGPQYKLFRNSLFKQLGSIDRDRNEVVHWNVINQVGTDADGNTTSVLIMVPPANWMVDINAPKRFREDLVAFSRKCEFYQCLIDMLGVTVAWRDKDKDVPNRWKPVFEQPIIYPPPDGHPAKRQSELWRGVNQFLLGDPDYE